MQLTTGEQAEREKGKNQEGFWRRNNHSVFHARKVRRATEKRISKWAVQRRKKAIAERAWEWSAKQKGNELIVSLSLLSVHDRLVRLYREDKCRSWTWHWSSCVDCKARELAYSDLAHRGFRGTEIVQFLFLFLGRYKSLDSVPRTARTNTRRSIVNYETIW